MFAVDLRGGGECEGTQLAGDECENKKILIKHFTELRNSLKLG